MLNAQVRRAALRTPTNAHAHGIASLSATVARNPSRVFRTIEEPARTTRSRRFARSGSSAAPADAACDLSQPPSWRAPAAAPIADASVAEALLEAHEAALEVQARELEAKAWEAAEEFSTVVASKQAELDAAHCSIASLEQRLAKQERDLTSLRAQAAAAPAPAAAAPDASAAEVQELQAKLASAHALLRSAVLDKAYAETPAASLLSLPADSLQGVGGKTAETLAAIGISTVGELSRWPALAQARAVAEESPDGAAAELAACAAEEKALKALRIKTVADAASFKYGQYALALKAVAEEDC